MTKNSLLQGREVMKKANQLSSKIKEARDNVMKWTRIESAHRENKRNDAADGAKKKIIAAMERLDKLRKEFADLKFPNSDIPGDIVSPPRGPNIEVA